MAAAEVNVATAALAIAVAALVIALGQLISQLFGTADGYRRCQSSVIGDWSKLVRLRFRWSSFRLEVRVTTPHFDMWHPDNATRVSMRPIINYPSAAPQSRAVAITGSDKSRQRTFSRPQSSRRKEIEDDEDEDVVSWTPLLAALHDYQQCQLMNISFEDDAFSQPNRSGLPTVDPRCAIVCISPKTRSWDLMPPDVVRPMASTTLGTLITMAHRMGMIWVDLLPRDGKMRAEGASQSISAALMRGMGIVVEYNEEANARSSLNWACVILPSLYVPSTDADKMACGIIPGNSDLQTWDMYLRSHDHDPDVGRILEVDMQVGAEATEAILQSVKHWNGGHHWPAFTDILGLWSDWVPMERSFINTVISPINHRIFTMGEAYESRVVWRWLLQERESQGTLSSLQRRVLRHYDSWEREEPIQFYQYYMLTGNDPEHTDAKTFFKKIYNETTAFFLDRNGQEGSSYYVDLVTAHVKVNCHSLKQADENFNAGRSRNDGRVGHNLYDTLFAERAFIYVDNIPKIIDTLRSYAYKTYDLGQVEDAWWMLMLRGQCWEMGINRVVQKSCVPSSYYNSPTRVYII